MTRRFFSGSTLDQAVMMAARHYGLDPKELAYRQIEKRHGFLRTRKAVMIAVDPETPGRQAGPPGEEVVAQGEPLAQAVEPGEDLAPQLEAPPRIEPDMEPEPRPERVADSGPEPAEHDEHTDSFELAEPAEPAEPAKRAEPTGPAEPAGPAEPEERHEREPRATPPPATGWDLPAGGDAEPAAADQDEKADAAAPSEHDQHGEEDEELLDAAERAAKTLLRFGGIDAEASAHSGPERVEVELEGPDSAVLVVENGTGLLAIQHLLPRMMRGLTGRSSFVRVDSEEFHGKRKERLQALALKEAEAVSRDGAPRKLPPMAPDERRIVHLAVQEIPTVVTESEGSGLHKRVVIRPAAADGGHDDIEARHGF